MRHRVLLASVVLLGALFVGIAVPPTPAVALSCGPCPATATTISTCGMAPA
jgi:hypothetical protein